MLGRMFTDLAGLWVPVVTPLDPSGNVDTPALGRLARRLLDEGCAGLVALGTTGEPATLRPTERRAVVDVCAEACVESGKPLMVGVGSNCTKSTIDDLAALEGTPALSTFWGSVTSVSDRWLPAAAAVPLTFAIAAVGFVGVRALLADLAIRPKKG